MKVRLGEGEEEWIRLTERLKQFEAKEPRDEPEDNGQEWKKELKKTEEKIMKRMEEEEERRKGRKRKVVIFTDSNGRNATTPDSILQHLPSQDRDEYDIQLEIVYHVEEAISRLESEENPITVADSYFIVDCLANDARQTRSRPALTPDELVTHVARLREKLWAGGAAGVVVCSLRPTLRANVVSHNLAVHRHLLSQKEIDGGYGSCSHVRLEHLGFDGLHLQPKFFPILQRHYANIIQGNDIPPSTPPTDNSSVHVRNTWNRNSVGSGSNFVNHGWSW